MNVDEAKRQFRQLHSAVLRLREALDEDESNPLRIDGSIQRFEFVTELVWRTLRRFLFLHGIETGTPRETIKQAYSQGWLENEKLWLDMIEARSKASHLYNEEMALNIYEAIHRLFPVFPELVSVLTAKLRDLVPQGSLEFEAEAEAS